MDPHHLTFKGAIRRKFVGNETYVVWPFPNLPRKKFNSRLVAPGFEYLDFLLANLMVSYRPGIPAGSLSPFPVRDSGPLGTARQKIARRPHRVTPIPNTQERRCGRWLQVLDLFPLHPDHRYRVTGERVANGRFAGIDPKRDRGHFRGVGQRVLVGRFIGGQHQRPGRAGQPCNAAESDVRVASAWSDALTTLRMMSPLDFSRVADAQGRQGQARKKPVQPSAFRRQFVGPCRRGGSLATHSECS